MSDKQQGVVMKTLIGILVLSMSVSAAAFAQQGHLDVKTVVQKEQVIVNEDGKTETRLVPAATVVPGENVVYTITFQNISDEAADDVVVTNPIADSLTYVEGSAFGPGTEILFSIDGGQTFAKRDELIVTENGETRAAGPSDFTHIRWVMQQDLAAGAQGIARFAAVLD